MKISSDPLFRIWLLALAVKFVFAYFLPFANDEAYYWVWGHHPHFSYYDHPPIVGWLFWLASQLNLEGNLSRLPGILIGHCTLLIWYFILRPLLSDQKLRWWLILVLFSPLMGVGSIIITPDTPLLFFWSLALFCLLQALKHPSPDWYAWLGASLGLGFCSKYHIVLFVPIALFWLFVSGEWRGLKLKYIPITVLTGLLFCFPVLYWNYTHDFASFSFQLRHGLEEVSRFPYFPVEYLIGQVLLIFPPLIYFLVKKVKSPEAQFLTYFAWLPLGFFLFTSFKARVEANWTLVAYPALYAVALINMPDLKWAKRTVAVWIIALILALSHLFHPWFPIDPKKIKTHEFTKYLPLVPVAEQNLDFYASSYQMAAAVSFHLGRQVYKLNGMNRKDFYDFEEKSFPQGDRFVVAYEPEQRLPEWLIEKGYVEVSRRGIAEDLGLIEVVKRASNSDH